jgi:hypothetical protein
LFVVLVAVYAALYLPSHQYSALGDLASAVGSILAVIWFSAALFYQSKQLEEQREQFQAEFKHLREENRRNALSISRDILRDAEERALKMNPALKGVGDFASVYLSDPSLLRTVLESTNVDEVLWAVRKWTGEHEGPVLTMLRGIKDAAQMYYSAIGDGGFDFTKAPEDFVDSYGATLWKLPYFGTYAAMEVVVRLMVPMQPGRKAVLIATSAALLKSGRERVMKRDMILKDIRGHREAQLPMPAIAADLIT